MYHKPVLLDASVSGLNFKPNAIYVDATFGGGGHTLALLSRMDQSCKLYAFDQDEDAQQNSIQDPRFTLIPHNFCHLKRFLRFYKVDFVDGILADLGVSSHQFDTPTRGFSIRFDGPLDMRMNQRQALTAAEIINNADETELAHILFTYGELSQARKIARQLVSQRGKGIYTTSELNKVLADFLPKGNEQKVLAKIYQALRMEVNKEVEVLQDFLLQCKEVLRPGGRLSVISYHSIEDRLIKRFIQYGNFTNEPIKDSFGNPERYFTKCGGLQVPSADEIKTNNRARSAKLRVAERV